MPLVSVQIDGSAELARAVQDYRALIKDDAGRALAKAARETAFAARELFRTQPPRPRRGTIASAATGRGFRFSTSSASYQTARKSADKILGEEKSGYFLIGNNAGVPTITPIIVGRSGRIARVGLKNGSLLTNRQQLSAARSKDLAVYRRLLTKADRTEANFEKRKTKTRALLDANRVPSGAVQLNRGALAALRTIALRESAARGGYLGSQFLTFRKVRNIGSTDFTTKDKKRAGNVTVKGDAQGDAFGATVTGYLPGSARIAQRENIVARALTAAARAYRADMLVKLRQRAARQFGRAA